MHTCNITGMFLLNNYVDLTARYINASLRMYQMLRPFQCLFLTVTVSEPLGHSVPWHFHDALIRAPPYCQSLHLVVGCNGIFHTTDMHIQHKHTHIHTCMKYSAIQKMLPSNVKELFEWKKRPLNWKDISQPAGSRFFRLYCSEQKLKCVWSSVWGRTCVSEYALARYWRTRTLGVWWLFCCTHAVRMALVVSAGTTSPE